MQPQKYTAFAGARKKPNDGFTIGETIATDQPLALELPAAAKQPAAVEQPASARAYWAEMEISASTPRSCATRMTPG